MCAMMQKLRMCDWSIEWGKQLQIVPAAVGDAGCRLPVAGCWVGGLLGCFVGGQLGCWVAGCRLPVAGCRLPVFGCRLPVFGCRFSVFGFAACSYAALSLIRTG